MRWSPMFAVLLAASGCAAPSTFQTAFGVDQQACAERGLVGMDDLGVLADAWELFDRNCSAGDPAACSALGRMYELGAGVPVDPRRARQLYQRACSGGNALGCSHLGGGMAANGPTVAATER
jgi:uncharacterized protein